jgi:hypothetical protein
MAVNFNMLRQAGPANFYEGLVQGQEQQRANALTQQKMAQEQQKMAQEQEMNALRMQQTRGAISQQEREVKAQTAAQKTGVFRERLLRARDPNAVRELVKMQYADPDLGPILSQTGTLEQALAEVPDDPVQFERHRQQEALGMSEWMKSQLPKTVGNAIYLPSENKFVTPDRVPPPPGAPVAVMGPDGKPRYVSREDALGMTPFTPAAVKFMGGGAGGGGGEGGSPTKLRPGEVYNAKLDRVEAKPGSELYNKQSKSHASDYKAASGTQSKMDESIAKIDNILDVKNKTAFEGNFGGYNAYGTRMLPGENSDLRKSIDSFKSDLKMAGLELIRQGGSIGQMTEREWPIVEQMIASIDPVLGEENARKVFEDIKTRFQTIKAAAQDVYDTQWSSTQYHKGLRGGAKGGDGKSSDVRSAADAILKGE